ncbi:M42 family peptidase [Candidatus Bathyarchaeota archaeon]|nr:MAG: M42 family peptidase [Candidatus Bathyarchaeota archaeon]
MADLELLKKLVEIPAPSGHEDRMITFIKDHVSAFVSRVEVDRVGNVIAIIEGRDEGAPRIMISCHMDEIGLIIRRIEDNGFLRFERLGGIEPKTLPAREVQVLTREGLIEGVIGIKAHHLAPYQKEVEPISEMYIDIGASSRQEALRLGVRVGDPVVFKPNLRILNGRYVTSKAMDNRAPMLAFLEALKILSKRRPESTLFFVATVLEEFNVRGSLPAAYKISPDFALCLDVAVATDTPDLKAVGSDIRLGRGVVLQMFSFHGRGTLGGLIPPPQLVRLIEKVAEQKRIPYQRSTFFGGLTEASFLPVLKEGIPAIDLGIPCRYTHSPAEMVAINDIDAMRDLLVEFLNSVDRKTKIERGAPA